METVVKVRWETGHPCPNVRVKLWIDGVANEDMLTDSRGEAHFSYGGRGTLYCDGKKVREGNLGSYIEVKCRSAGLYEIYS